MAGVVQWIECWPVKPKGWWFDSQSAHAWVVVWVLVGDPESMFDISLPLFLPPLSL